MPQPEPASAFDDLLDAVRLGDEGAWGLLCERFRPRLVARARALLRPFGGNTDPSGVVQEALVRAWTDCGQLRAAGEDELFAWLSCVLRNLVTDQIRALGRRKRDVARRCPLPEDSAGQAAVAGREPSPSAAAIRKEEECDLEDRLARLPHRDELIIRSRITDRCGWEEIAARAGTTAAAAERAFYRALKQLRTESAG